jgi:hypothetical protein
VCVYRTCLSTYMSPRKCRIEVVDLHLADGAKYAEDQRYEHEKRIHFKHEIQDLAEGTTWKALQACVIFDAGTCFGLVKLFENGAVNDLKIDYPLQVHEDCLDKQIQSGDVIEVRLKPLEKINRQANCFEMKVVHVNVGSDFTYRFDCDYDNLRTCEYTHYIYVERNLDDRMIQMYHDFLSNTARFPLVSYVARPDCSDVVVIARMGLRCKARRAKTIWKHGQGLKLDYDFKIEAGDVIEIRLTHVLRYEENMDVPSEHDECVVAEDKKWECIICLHNRRDVVFKPCNHCCVCQVCCKRMWKPMCPACYAPYKSWHKLQDWSETKDGKVFYSTAAMHDVYSLLTSLRRHCEEDTQVDDLLRK